MIGLIQVPTKNVVWEEMKDGEVPKSIMIGHKDDNKEQLKYWTNTSHCKQFQPLQAAIITCA